jgi:hypothetical protein
MEDLKKGDLLYEGKYTVAEELGRGIRYTVQYIWWSIKKITCKL